MPYAYNYKINFIKDFTNAQKKDLVNHGFNDIKDNSKDIFISYLNLIKRLVPSTPRKVLVSKEFKCPPKFSNVVETIKTKIENGDRITPYLSKKISDLDYNDPLLNDWGIHHLHLGNECDAKNPNFINRTGPLLFIRFTHDTAYFINIYNHGSWSNQEMIKIIHENWPDSIEEFWLKEVHSIEQKISDRDHARLRKSNLNTFVQVDEGVVYCPPGMGITSSGHSIDVIRRVDRYLELLTIGEKYIEENIGNIVNNYANLGLNEYNHMYFYPIVKDNKLFAYELYSSIEICLCDF